MTPERVLIVERDPKMVSLVREVLGSARFDVLVSTRGEQAIQMAAREQPALIILEVDLGSEGDGYEVIRRVRAFSDVPVIILAHSDRSEDVLRGFALGADDYVSKPFDPKILLARVQAVLRRCRPNQAGGPAEIICNNLVIDQAARRVMVDGVEVYLTETEYNLLTELARHHDRVLLHDQLLAAVWGKDYRNEISYLRSYIHILRRKIESNPARPRLILSRPGIGYMLATSPGDEPGE